MPYRAERRRLSTAYFLYFVGIGLYQPYFPAYLRGRGLTTVEIGWLLSLAPLFRGLLPTVFGYLADRVRGPQFWGLVTAWAMTTGLAVLALGPGWPPLLFGAAVYFMGSSATIPLLDASTVSHLGRTRARFGHIRLWGSVGYIVSAFGLGVAFPALPPALIAAALVGAHLLFATYVTVERLEDAAPGRPSLREVGALLGEPAVALLLIAIALNRLSSAPYLGFYTLFAQDLGFGGDVVAWTWGIAVTVEVGVMFLVDRWVDRFGATRVMACGFLVEALRFYAYSRTTSATALLWLAPGHGIAFTMGYVAGVRRVMQIIPDRLRATGQGLAAAATGLGQTAGFVLAGYLHEHAGNARMWLMAAAVGLVATVAALAAGRFAPSKPT
jgi:PPP family 3-phenylpropionic acid transporter